MEKTCERCGASPSGYNLLDYCASCSKDLCSGCMAEGCCGRVPAESGTDMDFADKDEPDESMDGDAASALESVYGPND